MASTDYTVHLDRKERIRVDSVSGDSFGTSNYIEIGDYALTLWFGPNDEAVVENATRLIEAVEEVRNQATLRIATREDVA